jgi:hypothetical protein
MPTAVKISDELIAQARIKSKIFKRSIAGQIEYWAQIGKIVEENPDLPLQAWGRRMFLMRVNESNRRDHSITAFRQTKKELA